MLKFLLLFTHALASLKVISPSSISDIYPKGIQSSLGNFGNPPYNTKITGMLWYISDNTDGCKAITFHSQETENIHYIIMFDKGNCSYSLKVKHAQDIGASAVVIVNSNPNEDITKVIMNDSGMGGNLYIPAMLISKEDGDFLKKKVYETPIVLSMGFEMPKSVNRIHLSLVLSTGNPDCQEFLKGFYEIGKMLTTETVDLHVHYVVIGCLKCKEEGYIKDNVNCLGGGRYCAPDPDEIVNGPLTGRNVVNEDLRQICLLKTIHDSSKKTSYEKFFLFHKTFAEHCSKNFNDTACSNKIMQVLGFSVEDVEQCVKSSFDEGANNLAENKILDKEIEYWHNYGVHLYPSVLINHQMFKGDLEYSALLDAICAGYYRTYIPDFCKGEDVQVIQGYSVVTVLFALVLMFGVLVAILFIYRFVAKNELQKEMRKQVNAAVSQYMALSDVSKMRGSDRQSIKSSYV